MYSWFDMAKLRQIKAGSKKKMNYTFQKADRQLQLQEVCSRLRDGSSPEEKEKRRIAAFFCRKKFGVMKNSRTFASLLKKPRAFSSAGLEHLPYKQRVGGSNPSTPTDNLKVLQVCRQGFTLAIFGCAQQWETEKQRRSLSKGAALRRVD